ncbi:MAG: ABC transporter permease, partial [Eubacteriales bacterium]
MPVDYAVRLDITAVLETCLVFLAIFLLQLLILLIRVARANPVSLLRSDRTGEKPPRGNLLFAAAGVVLLGAAYFIAVTTKDPMSAMVLFFVAVVMVILATYLLFITGSVTLCRILKKNRSYYYRKNHFAAVSQMAYRMKRNGADLASICILATMVLVMMSSSVSLYIGMEDMLVRMYPNEIGVSLIMDDISFCSAENRERLTELAVSDCPAPTDLNAFYWCSIAGVLRDGVLIADSTLLRSSLLPEDFCIVEFLPPEDYERVSGEGLSLAPGECLISENSGLAVGASFSVSGTDSMSVRGYCTRPFETGIQLTSYFRTVTVVPYDFAAYISCIDHLADYNGDRMADIRFMCNYNMDTGEEEKIAFYGRLRDRLIAAAAEEYGFHGCYADSRAASRSDFYSTYGALLFLGILLSVVFLFGAVLIIYYKQISEGLEDRARYGIMQKVGMTDTDIRKSINAQVLIVFLAPLFLAGVHLCFAFPMVWQLLKMFHLRNLWLVIAVTAGCYFLFCLFYAVVYRMTANVYYRLVRR